MHKPGTIWEATISSISYPLFWFLAIMSSIVVLSLLLASTSLAAPLQGPSAASSNLGAGLYNIARRGIKAGPVVDEDPIFDPTYPVSLHHFGSDSSSKAKQSAPHSKQKFNAFCRSTSKQPISSVMFIFRPISRTFFTTRIVSSPTTYPLSSMPLTKVKPFKTSLAPGKHLCH